MDPSIAHANLAPPRQRVYVRGLLPALLAHAVLGIALASGVQWKRTPDASTSVVVPGLDAPAPSPVATAALAGPTSAEVEPPRLPAAPVARPTIAEPETPARIAMGAAAERAVPSAPPRSPSPPPPSGSSSTAATPPATRPSFDCAKARSSPERIICADPELSRLDRELGRLHARAKAAAPDPTAFKRQNDQEWRLRESSCRDRECLLAWYENRREQLMTSLAQSGAPLAR